MAPAVPASKAGQQAYLNKYRQLHAQGLLGAGLVTVAAFLLLALAVQRAHAVACVSAWLLAEAIFHAWFRRHARRIAAQPARHRPQDESEFYEKFQQFVLDAPSIRQYTTLERCISRWFGDVPFDDIKRDNVAELFAYGFWYRTR